MRGAWVSIVVCLGACTRPDSIQISLPPGVYTVNDDIGEIPRGATYSYAAYAVNDERRDGTVPAVWASRDVSIATVDGESGAVTGQSVGETDVVASFWGLSASLHVTVECAYPARVTAASGDRVALRVGETTQLAIQTFDEKGRETCQPVSFGVADSTAVNVSADGLVTAVARGEADVEVFVPHWVQNVSVHVTVE